ncbi:hypothetical protein A2U01_0052660 [Trifolium medium]|uniref:Uncharacterized protein n=1 Tax=Trifolium medium TaxID=97028 RepID=A0A392R4B8_9FABA|nr:hypothetical protein [Trifolium medium]
MKLGQTLQETGTVEKTTEMDPVEKRHWDGGETAIGWTKRLGSAEEEER